MRSSFHHRQTLTTAKCPKDSEFTHTNIFLQIQSLSFNPDEDEDEEQGDSDSEEDDKVEESTRADGDEPSSSSALVPAKPAAPLLIPRKLGKNPDVDTSFLRDREREDQENELREQLRIEWEQRQEALKNEEIEITFSYWDGSGHRRSLRMKKGKSG